MPTIELKTLPMQIKAIRPGVREVDYIVSSDGADLVGDEVDQKALQEAWDSGYKNFPAVRLHHNPERTIGRMNKIETLTENGRVLTLATIKISKTEDEVWTKIEEGIYGGASIGFFPTEFKEMFDEETGEFRGFKFTKMIWVETSVTDCPCNRDARKVDMAVKEFEDRGMQNVKAPTTKGVVPSNPSGYGKNDTDSWEKPTLSDFTSTSWDELSDSEKRKIASHFAWAKNMPPENFGDLKLPHHNAKSGAVVWNGVKAAMGALKGARGGVDIDGDYDKVYSHLASHYREFGQEPPEKALEFPENQVGEDCMEKEATKTEPSPEPSATEQVENQGTEVSPETEAQTQVEDAQEGAPTEDSIESVPDTPEGEATAPEVAETASEPPTEAAPKEPEVQPEAVKEPAPEVVPPAVVPEHKDVPNPTVEKAIDAMHAAMKEASVLRNELTEAKKALDEAKATADALRAELEKARVEIDVLKSLKDEPTRSTAIGQPKTDKKTEPDYAKTGLLTVVSDRLRKAGKL